MLIYIFYGLEYFLLILLDNLPFLFNINNLDIKLGRNAIFIIEIYLLLMMK